MDIVVVSVVVVFVVVLVNSKNNALRTPFERSKNEDWSSKICLHPQRFVFRGKVVMNVCVRMR